MPSYKYKNLVVLWQEQEWDMLARASSEIAAMLVPTGLEGGLSVNYHEITDADSAVHLHYALRADYQKNRTIHKLIK